MTKLIEYKALPEWTSDTLPKGFRKQHNTKVGTWAKLTILTGKLQYDALDADGNVLETFVFDKDSDVPFVEPQAWHKVTPLTDDLRCQLSFYCRPEDYYAKKYKLTATHSEVLEVVKHIQSGKALDLGCGGGRNALYLQLLGFDVTAFDHNATAIDNINTLIAEEKLEHITAYVGDAHDANISGQYDLIVSTVVLMFLNGSRIPAIIDNMQACTKTGGYNLIVCAMDSDDYPMSAHQLPFGFGFKSGELQDYYKGWEIVKYNENVGHLHRLDAAGNPIALRFATLIAKKI